MKHVVTCGVQASNRVVNCTLVDQLVGKKIYCMIILLITNVINGNLGT